MQIIQLTRDLTTMVDDTHLDYLNQWNWYAHSTLSGYYAARRSYNTKEVFNYMHIVIGQKMGLIGLIDHIDLNGLNNQEYNLRGVTASQSNANRGLGSNNTSGYKGVTWDREKQKWQAQIRFQKHQTTLGYYDCPIEAAETYDRATRKLFGKHGRYNFPREGERGV